MIGEGYANRNCYRELPSETRWCDTYAGNAVGTFTGWRTSSLASGPREWYRGVCWRRSRRHCRNTVSFLSRTAHELLSSALCTSSQGLFACRCPPGRPGDTWRSRADSGTDFEYTTCFLLSYQPG